MCDGSLEYFCDHGSILAAMGYHGTVPECKDVALPSEYSMGRRGIGLVGHASFAVVF